jgi:lipoate---protein ligase
VSAGNPFDVDPYRAAAVRTVVVRRAPGPTLVLGSTQPESLVDHGAADRAGVHILRRRTGGGAVLLEPADPLWLDLWVPRGDPLWNDDAAAAVQWVGAWWSGALAEVGFGASQVQVAGGPPDPLARVVCFAALGAGEVHQGGKKVVGVAQWRSREGSLIHSAAYERWSPEPLLDLLAFDRVHREAALSQLAGAAGGFGESGATRGALALALLDSLPGGSWEIRSDGDP